MPASLTAESAAALLASSRYDPAIIPQLEAYVDAQCASQTYDLDANLALLKLYQFHPEQLKAAAVAKVLAKALMNLPATDYLACTYMVPERVMAEEPLAALAAAASKLEACCFRDAWTTLEPLRATLLKETPGFDEAVRGYMMGVFEITYQSVPTSHLKASLGLGSDGELSKLVATRKWTVEGDLVKIALNDSNTNKPKRVDAGEAMGLDAMSKILSSVMASGA